MIGVNNLPTVQPSPTQPVVQRCLSNVQAQNKLGQGQFTLSTFTQGNVGGFVTTSGPTHLIVIGEPHNPFSIYRP
jgi:hypothetical protein